jgi:hypothetical protein
VLGTATALAPTATDLSGNYSISDTPPTGGAFTYTVTFAADATHDTTSQTAPVAVSLTPAGTFTGVQPARLLDTRAGAHTTDGLFVGGGALGAGGTVAVTVAGRGGVPALGQASSVVLNITATGSTTGGYLAAYPSGTARPTASSINFAARTTVANLVTVKVGADGKVAITNAQGSTNVIADVVGFYSTGSGPSGFAFHTQTPNRVMDTRLDTKFGPLGPNEYAYINYPDAATGPRFDVRAVALNITVVRPQTNGYISVIPATTGTVNPSTSNLNYHAGQTVSNMTIVATAPYADPQVPGHPVLPTFFVANVSAGSTDVIVDQVGWYDLDENGGGLTFTPLAPLRILDTRNGTGHSGKVGAAATIVVGSSAVGSASTGSLVMNVTATNGTAPSTYLKLWATGSTPPGTSNLGVTGSQSIANMAIVGVDSSTARDFSIFNSVGSVNVIADVAGSFDDLVLPSGVRVAARAAGPQGLPPVAVTSGGRLHL